MKDKELDEYKQLIGKKEYERQYRVLYQRSYYHRNTRFSHKEYENSEQRLEEIKEKYKNGIPDEVVKNFIEMLMK